jgi:hypothetical protein
LHFGRGGTRDFILHATKSLLIAPLPIHRPNWRSRFSLAGKCSEIIFEFFNRIDPLQPVRPLESSPSTIGDKAIGCNSMRAQLHSFAHITTAGRRAHSGIRLAATFSNSERAYRILLVPRRGLHRSTLLGGTPNFGEQSAMRDSVRAATIARPGRSIVYCCPAHRMWSIKLPSSVIQTSPMSIRMVVPTPSLIASGSSTVSN